MKMKKVGTTTKIGATKFMSCECFNNCKTCVKHDYCPYDYQGDGSPFCHEFICNVDECKRSFCISDDEIRGVYTY